MHTLQQHQSSSAIYDCSGHHVREIGPYELSCFQIVDKKAFPDFGNLNDTISAFQANKDEYFTLESSTLTASIVACDSPAASNSTDSSTFSTQGSHSCVLHHSHESMYGSPKSSSSSAGEGNVLWQKLREVEVLLMEPEADINDGCNFCFMNGQFQSNLLGKWDQSQLIKMIPELDLKEVLITCAKAVSDKNIPRAASLMYVLEQMVSVCGNPVQRLGAYMLEGLRARLEFSGSKIYQALKCDAPISSDLMTYMGLLTKVCPYWGFAYKAANTVIWEVVQYEPIIHIIDFQIAQGSQWIPLIKALARRPGGPPVIHITGVDDSLSAYARAGGLHLVGQKLSKVAESLNVPFEFIEIAVSGSQVQRENLKVLPGEALVVNFPFMLHHVPDESVNTCNHRDRLLRFVKSLSPKIVTLVEQESNTNTKPFFPRFLETLEFYAAVLESIDAGCPRDHKHRVNAEQNCVARDIVNLIACEDAERVERHELLGKWRLRFSMAGFTPHPLGSAATQGIKDLLSEYNKRYGVEERDGALYLLWKSRPMATASAWK